MNTKKSLGFKGIVSMSTTMGKSLFRSRKFQALTACVLVSIALSAQAAITVSTVVSFTGTNGSEPNSLLRATDGNFYGTTLSGGTNHSLGTLFQLSSDGVLKTLVTFDGTNGSLPVGLLQGLDGNFYGVASQGGANGDGTIFRFSTNGGVTGGLTTLVAFAGTNGSLPNIGLVQSPRDGSFYGTTLLGGNGGNNGTVFQLTTNGIFSTLLSFNDTNGANPYGAVSFGPDGALYGTTHFGGGFGDEGTVFRLTTNGVFSNLFSFDGGVNGGNPYSSLITGTDGNLYGTTSQGSTNGFGSVYRITTNGTLTTLLAFNSTNGATPLAPLIQTANGNFYGTTLNGGTNNNDGVLFQLTTNNVETPLFSFGANSAATGANPNLALVPGPGGTFYGTTMSGGANGVSGTIFKLSLFTPIPPITLTLSTTDTTLSLAWNSAVGINYQLQANPDLATGSWTNFGNSISATGTNTTTTTDTLKSTGSHFYRVVATAP